MTDAALLEVRGLSKSFGGEHALVGADLTLPSGEIRALVGANGSGKSTLVKILAGYHEPDEGTIRVRGEAADPNHAGGLPGFRFVHQDLALIGELTVAENLVLDDVAGARRLRPVFERRQEAEVQPLLDSYDVGFRASTPVGELSMADRTIVAVMRAFHQAEDEIQVLVLDEVTATLPPPEVDRLFTAIRRLPPTGVSVLFVSHRIEEILGLCDTVTVLRNGRVVGERAIVDTNEQDLVQLITGHAPQDLYPDLQPSGRRPVLATSHLAGGPLSDVTLELHEGEIVGLASADPTEASYLLKLIYGVERADQGSLVVDGEELGAKHSPHELSRLGVSLVADRHEGGIEEFSVRENLTLNGLSSFFRRWRLNTRLERAATRELIAEYHIVPANPEAVFSGLSGGNQQKAVLAKSLRLEPRVLLLDDPTRGVDIGARAVLLGIVRGAAERGLAVLMSSTDLDELCGTCHRVIVLKDGRSSGVIEGAELTPHSVLERCYLAGNGSTTTEGGVR